MDNPQNPPDQYTQLMAAVGSALLSWSQAENAMGLLFSVVSGIPDPHRAGAIFDAMKSFDVRLAVLDVAAENEPALTEDEKELWACLSRRLRSLYKKRHGIAHFSVGSADEILKSERISPFFTWYKHTKKKLNYLTKAEIYARSTKFNEAGNAVTWFGDFMQRRKRPGSLPEPPLAEPVLIPRMRESIARSKQE